MTLPMLVGQNNRPLAIDRQIASGGEGAVFGLSDDPNSVVKVYHPHRPPTAQTIEKLTAMLGMVNPQLLKLTTWPTSLAYDARTRQVAGFVMPKMSDCQPIQCLYNPVQRLKLFPRAGWSFQVRAAQNLAAAFDEVHKAGCLVGDVNQSNAFVSPQALVWLVDCDSFQVQANGKSYLCEVGVPHYIPPELQGKSLRGLTRTENHDRFGLAVLIYQLLFVGRHPYAGVYQGAGDPSFEQLIAEYRFAQGPSASKWGMAPPPHTPTFADIPPETGMLFRRAFERGSETGARPKPNEWISALRQLEQEIADCPVDAGHKFWRGSKECVWCRLAAKGGPEYYYGVAGGHGTFVIDESKLQEIQRRLAAAQHADFAYAREQFSPATPPVPLKLPPDLPDLLLMWGRAKESQRKILLARQAEEENEIRQAEEDEGKAIKRLEKEHWRRKEELEDDYENAKKANRIASRNFRMIGFVLLGAMLSGIVMFPLGCFHRTFAWVGLAVFLVFGLGNIVFAVVTTFSPHRRRLENIRRMLAEGPSRLDDLIENELRITHRAKREAEERSIAIERHQEQILRQVGQICRPRIDEELYPRKQRHHLAEEKLLAIEKVWTDQVNQYRREKQSRVPDAVRLIAECRELSTQHQTESRRLAANAEEAGRLRHLRLHLISDADILQIGAGRKQTLAAHFIFTAADVEEDAILEISGFGEVLTSNLMAWRARVLSQFRFDPKTAVSPAEQMALASRFRTRQQQILAELDRQLSRLESLAPACQAAIKELHPELKKAVAVWEQARADLRLMTGKD
ncbi:hypothetical protein [Zavarzinella formosa]|uniref:hypothetical protein n=1 Tax=Zavarzinella formosa TaxID=360055 RepID=UPI00038009C9|nr:hypothetical protein [Zavarzinella formosa]